LYQKSVQSYEIGVWKEMVIAGSKFSCGQHCLRSQAACLCTSRWNLIWTMGRRGAWEREESYEIGVWKEMVIAGSDEVRIKN
jgi:hypothetical protein